MILLLHVLTASASVAFTARTFFQPSALRMRIAYVLAFLTVASGIWLVVVQPAVLSQACEAGLVYSAAVFLALVSARSRLTQ